MSTAVFVQTTPTKKIKKDIKMDAKDLWQYRKELRNDFENDDKTSAAAERKDI